jgi:threonine dehydrogenase-like Zn-dependent dehydrogenase
VIITGTLNPSLDRTFPISVLVRGADVVITAAASGTAQEQGLRMLARRGRLSLFGGLAKDAPNITVDSNLVHYQSHQ